ncbi:MAG: hypothetical protein LBF69_04510 [Prevotellaceae bacterium]|nr:hypothetical protein [Prevotellaceae bacterium]
MFINRGVHIPAGMYRSVEDVASADYRIPPGCVPSASGYIPTERRCCGGYGISTERCIPMGCKVAVGRGRRKE